MIATVDAYKKAAGGVLTAKQAPHRPGTAPALGLRAGRAILSTADREESLMTLAKNRVRLAVEQFEDRCTPSGTGAALPAANQGLFAAARVGSANEHATRSKWPSRWRSGATCPWTALGQLENFVVVAGQGVYTGAGTIAGLLAVRLERDG